MILVTLVCASIIRAHRPGWLTVSIASLAASEGVCASRISRLKKRAIQPFRSLIERLCTRGPNRDDPAPRDGIGVDAILKLTARALESLPGCRRDLQDWLVQFQEELHDKYGTTQEQFCRELNISDRTFRSWKRRGSRKIQPSRPRPTPSPGRPESPGLGAFDLDALAPGVWLMGDTSDVEMFGVKLKMIATQDPGERDRNLWTSFDVTLRDDSEEVVRVAEAAIREQETPCL